METRVNFVEYLQIDVVMSILMFLDNPADLIRASAVSHSWRNFFIAHSLCKKLCLRKAPPLSNICGVVEEEDGILIMNAAESSYSGSSKVFEREHKMYSSLLQALANSVISPEDCIGCVVGASSTDRDPEESIVHTLLSCDRYKWGCSYWSSKGQEYSAQPFKLPEPALCIGGFLLIELLGRAQKEEVDGLYYICVGSIRVLGRPLKPAFELLMETTEELFLKYCPDALFDVLQNSSHPRQQLPHQPQDMRLVQQTDALFQRTLAPQRHFLRNFILAFLQR